MQKIHSILTGSIPLRRIHRPWNCIYFVALPFFLFYFFTFPALFITGLVCHVRRGGKKKGTGVLCKKEESGGKQKGNWLLPLYLSSYINLRALSAAIALFTSAYVLFFFILFREQALKTTAAAKYFVLNDLIYLW